MSLWLIWPNRANFDTLTEEQKEGLVFAVWPLWAVCEADGFLYPVEQREGLFMVNAAVGLRRDWFDALSRFFTWHVPNESVRVIGHVKSLDPAGYEAGFRRTLCEDCIPDPMVPLLDWIKGVVEVQEEFTQWMLGVVVFMEGGHNNGKDSQQSVP